MTIDLTRARELIAKTEQWQLDDKLKRAYNEPLGEVFWALHKAGALTEPEFDTLKTKLISPTGRNQSDRQAHAMLLLLRLRQVGHRVN